MPATRRTEEHNMNETTREVTHGDIFCGLGRLGLRVGDRIVVDENDSFIRPASPAAFKLLDRVMHNPSGLTGRITRTPAGGSLFVVWDGMPTNAPAAMLPTAEFSPASR
jgi:hypothetical protein